MKHEETNYCRELLESDARRILEQEYHHDVPPDVPVHYFLSFKTEGRLGALRDALDRLEAGAYGRCIVCLSDISIQYLRENPTTRFCRSCDLGREGKIANEKNILTFTLP